MIKRRYTYLDSAAGILLIYMIVYHCAQWSGLEDIFLNRTLIFSFFMPWFFFKSGMFYRPITLRDNISKGFRRLIIPWIAFTIIGTVAYFCILYFSEGEIPLRTVLRYAKGIMLTGTSLGNMALWFLFSLFVVRILYGIIEPMRHAVVLIALIVMIPVAMHYVIEPNVSQGVMLNIPYYVCNIPAGLVFYALGHRLKKYNPGNTALCVITVVYTVCMIFWPSYVFMYHNKLQTGIYILAPIYALLGIIAINGICRRFADKTNILSRIGADTMPYYCMHWIVIEITAALADALLNLNAVATFIVLIAANIVMLPLLTMLIRKTRLKFIFG